MSFIKNRTQLLYRDRRRELLLNTIEQTLLSIQPDRLIEKALILKEDELIIKTERKTKTFPLRNFKHIHVLGWGKASGRMAEQIEKILPIEGGVVNILKGTRFKTKRIKLNQAEHPIAKEGSLRGTIEILSYAESLEEDDLVICLISGGGSAMLSLPLEGIELHEKQLIVDKLMKAGADINELNCVRKHLSQVKGGRLAEKLHPATIINLILSDVIGDPLDVISSGPTVPDTTTFSDAKRVLLKYKLWDTSLPCRIIEKGVRGLVEETPKRNNRIFKKVHSFIIGNNRTALLSASSFLNSLGVKHRLIQNIKGDAREAGRKLACILKKGSFVAGGETTVKVTGKGAGGRNQEVALSCALAIAGFSELLFASFGTDGVDGNSPAAGAVVDGLTISKSKELGVDAEVFQKNNDTYNFFRILGDCIITGATGTNLNDVMIGLKLKNR
ncbi:MAG: glycerate kinase [Candidatus Micrarchaeia archaeon]